MHTNPTPTGSTTSTATHGLSLRLGLVTNHAQELHVTDDILTALGHRLDVVQLQAHVAAIHFTPGAVVAEQSNV